MNPLFSVVIPVYNGSNYLKEAIESVLNQTYQYFEIIVVNDGSNDNGKTEEIALSYGDKIRYFYKENGGVSSALNLGIKNMRGDYFIWLSHDDMLAKNRLEKDADFFKKNKEAKVVFSDMIEVDSCGVTKKENLRKFRDLKNPYDVLSFGGIHFCAITLDKICFSEVGLFNENNKTCQDIEMSMKLSKVFQFYYNENIGLFIRKHKEQGSNLLKNIWKKNAVIVGEYIYKNFSINDFFPNIEMAEKFEKSSNYEWLGDRLRNFHCFDYADQYYLTAYSYLKKKSLYLKIFLGAEKYHFFVSVLKFFYRKR